MSPFLLQAHLEARWPGVYFNPARWATVDGYIPCRLYVLYVNALYPLWAMERLTLSSAINLAFAPAKGGDLVRAKAVAEAYPLNGAAHG